MIASLYGDLLAAGVPMDNHESDLYFTDTADSRAILDRWPDKVKMAIRFETEPAGALWKVPFAFLPWREKHEQRRFCRALGQLEVIEPSDLTD